MSMDKKIEEKINKLPKDLQKEVIDFIDFLLEKQKKKPKGKLKLDWAGGLKDLKDKFTSVELQHKILQWRIENEFDRY